MHFQSGIAGDVNGIVTLAIAKTMMKMEERTESRTPRTGRNIPRRRKVLTPKPSRSVWKTRFSDEKKRQRWLIGRTS